MGDDERDDEETAAPPASLAELLDGLDGPDASADDVSFWND